MIYSVRKGKLRSPRGYHQYNIVMTLLKGPNFQWWSQQFALENAVCHGSYDRELSDLKRRSKNDLFTPKGQAKIAQRLPSIQDSYDSPKRPQLSVVEPAVCARKRCLPRRLWPRALRSKKKYVAWYCLEVCAFQCPELCCVARTSNDIVIWRKKTNLRKYYTSTALF